jgi:DmsE family decaheme c-type cytochrome
MTTPLIRWITLGAMALAMHMAHAAGDSAAAAASVQQDAVCTRCHDEGESVPILAIYQTRHGIKGDPRTPSCQSCHGGSAAHLKDKAVPPDVSFGAHKSAARAQDGACLACHRNDKRTHWDGGQHQSNEVSCSGCHAVHAAVDRVRNRKTQTEVCFQCHQEQRAEIRKASAHPIDSAKVICSDCHNPHGSAGPKLLKKNTVLETCYSCHAEKRGPFLWEHQPVTEDCTHCHTPHGSNIAPLLKSRPPFLCDECHDGPHNSVVPYGPGAALGRPGAAFIPGTSGEGGTTSAAGYGDRSAAGRACMNCHNMVHGSNSPSGAFLHR